MLEISKLTEREISIFIILPNNSSFACYRFSLFNTFFTVFSTMLYGAFHEENVYLFHYYFISSIVKMDATFLLSHGTADINTIFSVHFIFEVSPTYVKLK